MSLVDVNAEVEISTPDRGRIDATSSLIDRGRKARTRSLISNGSALLPNVDGRGPIYRRYKDIANAILSDQGGVNRACSWFVGSPPSACWPNRRDVPLFVEHCEAVATEIDVKLRWLGEQARRGLSFLSGAAADVEQRAHRAAAPRQVV